MSALLQTAMANASLQSGHPPSPAKSSKRLPSEKGRARSSASASSKDMTDEEDSEDHPGYSDDDSDDDEMVNLATRPSTPVSSHSREREGQDSHEKAGRFVATRDPVKMLPSGIMLRVFLQLDIKSLARCDRVCKRWRKSQTLNYTWFLHTRSFTLPQLKKDEDGNYINRQSADSEDFDPYDKAHWLTMFKTPVPASTTPQWSKRESKQAWRLTFKGLITRKENPSSVQDFRVDVDALSSGLATPLGELETGYGGNSRPASGASTPKSKKEMRDHYKSLQGRKSKGKGNLGGTQRGVKDIGGAGEDRFSAPW